MSQVIEWFNSLQDKHKLKFLIFDIEEFHPSISEGLIEESLDWTKQFTDIIGALNKCGENIPQAHQQGI